MRFLIYLFGTFFFTGRVPFASGTAGSFAALVLYMAGIYLLPAALFPLVHALGIVLFIGLGIPAASYIERHEGIEDPGCVEIDEAAGQWVTLLFISPALVRAHLWIPAAAFFLFRFFDITKLFPANRAEKLPGGLGIIMDDVIAGLYACLILNLIVKLVIL
jgi:phosphatidylglycerophosphatase A